ncbi:MAG: PQQ-dependent sugar dehydrogenase [Prosthecobacter sp.]|jgi:glucose/arabinose dehydrogenase
MKLTLCALFALLAVSTVQAVFPTLYLKPVCAEQLHSPTNITHANDGSGRLFICEQQGKVFIFQGGMLLPTPFMDLTGSFVTLRGAPAGSGYDERGLLGMAFHPGYANSSSAGYRKFYVYYMKDSPNAPGTTNAPVDSMSVISEFQASATNPNAADLASERVLLSFDQPQFNHNGGQLEFGPDGMLYIGFGDGGSSNDNNAGHTGGTTARPNGILGNGQDRRVIFGKILRIDPADPDGAGPLTYTIPPDNPFVGQTQDLTGTQYDGPMRGEIYAYGLRNPWRFSFDKRPGGTNRLFCGDVGQGKIEEINLITSGGNYGWRYLEGTFVFDSLMSTNGIAPTGTTNPVAQYAHPGATGVGTTPQLGLSVTGGYVYRGSAIPALQGKYLFGDYGATSGLTNGRIMGLEETSLGSGVFTLTQALPIVGPNPILGQRILCMGEDQSGELYIGMKTTGGVLEMANGLPAGSIYKIVPVSTSAATTTMTTSRDTSMFQEFPTHSNSFGSGLFAGRLYSGGGGHLRRALLGFDLSSLPEGTSIAAATLRLTVNKVPQYGIAPGTGTLHRMLSLWTEGITDAGAVQSGDGQGVAATPGAGDATWSHANYDGTVWTSPGGDFSPISSASLGNMISIGDHVWSSPFLARDVQQWFDLPETNHGWILRISEGTTGTARRFATRDEQNTSQRPLLTLYHAVLPASASPQYDRWAPRYFPAIPIGGYIQPDGDQDGDSIGNLVEYAYGFDPTTRNTLNGLSFAATGGGTGATAAFRRDPRATDLVYELQASDDLIQWDTIVTSTAGAAPTGLAFVSEAPISGEEPIRLVNASGPVSGGKTFIRLKITRTP